MLEQQRSTTSSVVQAPPAKRSRTLEFRPVESVLVQIAVGEVIEQFPQASGYDSHKCCRIILGREVNFLAHVGQVCDVQIRQTGKVPFRIRWKKRARLLAEKGTRGSISLLLAALRVFNTSDICGSSERPSAALSVS